MARKIRISVPEELAAQVLFASDHTCCKCEERGLPVQIHHIDENPANSDPLNLAVLCLICHDETQVKGGFARRLSPAEVRLYRDNWLQRVEKRRRDADVLVVARMAGTRVQPASTPAQQTGMAQSALSGAEIEAYVESLPGILLEVCNLVRRDWNEGPTVDMVRAAYYITEVLTDVWLRLATAFPEGHFQNVSPEEYLHNYLQQRYGWHRAMAEPHGYGTGGTIVGILVSRGVLRDLERSVIDTRNALKGLAEQVSERDAWMLRWRSAKQRLTPPP
jgi:hypothetical protein